MRIPPKAPTLAHSIGLVANGGPELFQKAVRMGAVSAAIDGRYMHWHKLRFRPAPEGLTPAQWWAMIKIARGTGVAIPLRPVSPNEPPFQIRVPPALHQLVAVADQRLRGVTSPHESLGHQQLYEGFRIAMKMEEAITSSQLEGAATTRPVAQEMLRKARSPRNHSERMIFNNYAGMKFVQSVAAEPMTPELLLEIHRIMSNGTMQDPADSGRLRTQDDVVVVDRRGDIVLHTPPASAELPARIEELCRFANATETQSAGNGWIHPILRAVILHFWLAYDHPFVDGNGRTARALFYWYMQKMGYALVEHISISQLLCKSPAKYVSSYLYTETDENDLTYFAFHQLETINRAIAVMDEFAVQRSRELSAMRRRIEKSDHWNERQLFVISELMGNPEAKFTPVKLCNTFGIAKPTAIRDLREMEAAGIFTMAKVKRQLEFTPVADALERLRAIGNG